MKNLLKGLLSLVVVAGLVGCGPTPTTTQNTPTSNPGGPDTPTSVVNPGDTPTTTQQTTPSGALEAPDSLKGAFAGKKVILTSIGQSGDIDVFANVLDAAGMVEDEDFVMNKQVKAADVKEGDVIVMMLGASSKGLGDLGISITDEINRVNEFAAIKDKVTILALHTGGQNRRGATTDPSIDPTLAVADYALVVSDGDDFNGLSIKATAAKYGIGYGYTEKNADLLKAFIPGLLG